MTVIIVDDNNKQPMESEAQLPAQLAYIGIFYDDL